MNSSQQTEATVTKLARWSGRVSGLLSTSCFLFIIILVFINEDSPKAEALPTLFFLMVAIMGTLVAWQWVRIGGMVLVISAIALAISVHRSSVAFGLEAVGLLLRLLVYSLPPLFTGLLYLLTATRVVQLRCFSSP